MRGTLAGGGRRTDGAELWESRALNMRSTPADGTQPTPALEVVKVFPHLNRLYDCC